LKGWSEMNNELKPFDLNGNTVIVDVGTIQFPVFQQIKDSALKLAKYIQKVEVTEDNVKQSKKLVAEVSKQVKSLNDERITIKKQMLKPYDEFEQQIKEISDIVKSSEEIVRHQIRQLEEAARDIKREEIEQLFDLRMNQYDFGKLFSVEDFTENQYLNKSFSMTKIEKSMVEWFEKIARDLSTIKSLKHADEVLATYKEYQDLSLAIGIVNERHEKINQAKAVVEEIEPSIFMVNFIIRDEKDAKLVEMFMNQNKIKFEKVGN